MTTTTTTNYRADTIAPTESAAAMQARQALRQACRDYWAGYDAMTPAQRAAAIEAFDAAYREACELHTFIHCPLS